MKKLKMAWRNPYLKQVALISRRDKLKRTGVLLLLIFSVILYSTCTDKEDDPPGTQGMSVDADITIEGGTLEVMDANGNTIGLTIPPGAVMETVQVSLTLVSEDLNLPIDERKVPAFKIRPIDINLYKPAIISIDYEASISEIEKTALFRVRSEDWLTPLSDHTYSNDSRSMTAATLFFGDFAEGKMTLEQIITQYNLLVSSLDISEKKAIGQPAETDMTPCDTRVHKEIWDIAKDVAGSFLTTFNLKRLNGYYDDVPPGEFTEEEDEAFLCKEVLADAIQKVLDECIPEDQCDKDYTHTIADIFAGMRRMGCIYVDLISPSDEYYKTINSLNERFDEILIDCESYLIIDSELNIESGGLQILTYGIVPLILTRAGTNIKTVEGMGNLAVTGSGTGGGVCVGIVSGETIVDVQGTQDADYTFELTVLSAQVAVLTTVCPNTSVDTPLTGSDSQEIVLSRANGHSLTIEQDVEGGIFKVEYTLMNPYTSIPQPEE